MTTARWLLVAAWMATLGLFTEAPAPAQCPVPAPSPPVIDGFLDPVYTQRGFTTDYVANNVNASARLYQIDDVCVSNQFIYLAWEIELGFTDNSYGNNRNKGTKFPWPGGHSFFDLAESDGQRLQILNVCGQDVVDIFMDYLDGTAGGGSEYGTPSGYDVGVNATETALFLINGGDWSKFTYDTSQAHNLNDLGFCTNDGPGGAPPDCDDAGTNLLVDSPPWSNENDFVPQAPYGAWNYQHIYEIRIDRSVFSTAACPQGTPALIRTDPVELHASPSKIGESPVDLFRASSTIGDYVWLDADRDGVQDAGETGLANVTVALYKDDGDGVFEPDVGTTAGDDGPPVLTTVTDANGRYSFTRLGEGTYFVDVTDALGILSGFAITSGPQTETDPTGAIVLPRQEEYLDADFGYAPSDLTKAVVGDFVWSDADGDGIQERREAGIGGVTVDLVDLATTTVVATAITAADGSYLFTGVDPGDYYVDVTDTFGVLAGYTLTSGPQSETDPSTAFHLDAGDVYLNADFGYNNPALGAIGNLVWFDADEDAVRDAGEPGLGNVTLALIDDADGDGVWDSGELIIASTTTATDGTYSFPGLVLDDGGGDGDADYLVWVSDTRNVLGQFLEAIFLPLGSTADNVSKIAPYAVDLTAGLPVDSTADFGYVIDNPAALVGDRVWYDDDGDGVQDVNEPGIEDVRLVLWDDKNKNGIIDGQGGNKDVVIASRTTDINGNYFFQRLHFDNNGEGYIVVVSQFNLYDIFNGRLDLNGNGTAGDAGDDGTVDGKTVIDGRIDFDGDGTIETNGQDNGTLSGFRIVNGDIDLDGDGTVESNGDDSRFGPLENFTQTGDPDEVGTCAVCNARGGTVVNTTATIVLTIDFGYDGVGTLTIGDTVYHDLDGDGVQDAGEPGLELVTLALYQDLDGDGVVDVDEPLIAEKVTDANGFYQFGDLVSGDYVVVVTDDSGILTGYTQTQGSPFEPVASSELSTADKDFGFVRKKPATISNFLWEDTDGDGIQDAGEPGIRNVTVNLYDPGPDGQPGGGDDVLVKTTTTDAAGLYSFSVQAGSYFVEVVPPSGYAVTRQNQGGDATLDSDPSPATGQAAVTLLIIGENDPTWDIGLYRPVAVGDRVWLDADGDGVQDVGEPGIANVTLELFDAGPNGVPGGGDDVSLGTVVTDGNGFYVFAQEPPATYFVDLLAGTLPAGLTLSGGSDPSTSTTLLSSQITLEKDFGYTDDGNALIGDRVWSDADADGVQDPGEPGIGGVTLDLVSPGPDGVFGTGDDVVEDSVVTAADGSYLFTGVAAGVYRVDVTGAPAGYSLTSGPQSSSDPSAPITVAAGDVVLTADFGYFQAGLGTIGNQVWLDADGDGFRDAGEAGIGGVTIALARDTNGDGVWDPDGIDNTPGNADDESLIATTATAAAGTYGFAGLPLDDGDGDADYLVIVTDNAKVLDGFTKTSGTAGANDNSQATPYSVALSAGSPSNATADFGYNRAGSLGDRVWSDGDGDGVQDAGEAGIGGVTVELRDASSGALLESTVTAGDGSYLFSLLLPGSYRVVMIPGGALAGYTQTGDPDEAGTCAICDGESTTTLAAGASDLTRDFGYRNTALPDVSGTVFHDVNENAFEDAGEAGFSGVTLALVLAGSDGIFGTGDDVTVATTTTDANGDYLFPDVAAGSYQVVVTDDAGILDAYRLTTGLDRIPVTVAAADVTDVDFGYVRGAGTGSLGDTVWLDVDPPGAAGPDGVRGPNEAGLPGVTLLLYRDADGDGVAEPGGDDGAAIATTVTDANGEYRFTGLAAGNYFVDVDGTTLPANLTPTTGTTDPSAVVPLAEGQRYDDADFGYLPSAGTGLVGDFVWYDADSDGLQDPGEVGIAGVTVNLSGAGLDGEFGTGDDFTATTTTAFDGSYLFTGLPPDDYVVYFDPATLPAGYATTPTNTGSDSTYRVLLAAGDVLTHLDWGFDGGAVGSIGDFVWLDLDGDGAQDAGEPGLAGVTLNLVGPGPNMTFGDSDDEILATTTTGTAGGYLFAGLPLGQGYQVVVTDVDGVLDGLRRSSTLPGTLTPTAGTPNLLTADFGYAPAKGTGSLGTHVWRDLDFDGVRDAGEPPVQGVTLAVWLDANGNGVIEPGTDNLVRTAVTDQNGEYDVKALPFGDYLVDVTDANGVLTGMSKTSGTAGADDNSQADPYAVTLSSGSPRDVTADFGYRAAAAPLAISGTVFEDADVDATFDSLTELVVPSAEVFLYRVVGGRRFLVSTTTTDVNGFYSFGDLAPGSYEVAVDTTATSVDGFVQTTQSSTGGVQPVTLTTADSTGNDFGFFDGGVTTTPVTLAYFESRGDAGWAEIEWQTVTEVGHVGFNLWSWQDGAWKRLNEEIIPSSGADALELRSYRFEAADAGGGVFMLEDLDILGTSRYHGPFELGEAYGRKDRAGEPIPWKAIGAEHAAMQAERLRAAASRLRGKAGAAGSARLLVDAAGVYRVTYEELAAAGLDLAGVAAAQIAVLSRGAAVPARVEPRGVFGPGSFVEFIGEGLDTLYTKTNVYVVTVAPAQARAISDDGQRAKGAAAAHYQETLRVEHDRAYSFAAPNGDPWYDTHVLAFGSPASASFAFETESRVAGAGPAAMTVGLWGVTDWHQAPDHHVVVEVNGVALAEAVFDGTTDHPMSFEVPESVLAAGENTLRVVLPADNGLAFELVNVDHFSVTYPRRFVARDGALTFTAAGDVFEVEGLAASDVVVYRQTSRGVQLLTGAEVTGAPGAYRVRFPGDKAAATYHVTSAAALKKPRIEPGRPPANLRSGAAELLVISHPDFLGGLDRLMGARQAQGWTVKVVDVEDVYEQFGFGIFDPRAIRDYVAFARQHLETRAVLLVGGDTYDYLDVLGLGGVSFIPSLYGPTGQFVRFAPADGLYADVDGDEVPDLAIGRFPVRTAADLEALVDKTLRYETRSDRRSLVLAADDYDEPSRFDFAVTSEQLATRVPGDWRIDRVYADVLGQAGARAELKAKLDAGPAVTSFMGHSGPTTWSFDGLFSADDAAALANAEPTVVAQWGCWTTYYVSPFHETLAHKLLLSGDRGAAAVLGATTLTEARSERALALEIFRQLFGAGRTLGDAVLEAKRRLAAAEDPAVVDVLLGWNLLGDPTLGLAAPEVVPLPAALFSDGFEGGNTSAWSAAPGTR